MAARRRANGNTESVDNYLKAILSLGGREESRVTIKALAGPAVGGACLGDEHAAEAGAFAGAAGGV